MLQAVVDDAVSTLRAALTRRTPTLCAQEIGTVLYVGGGIARVQGLPSVTSEELVQFAGSILGDSIGDAEAAVQERVLRELPELCKQLEAGDNLDQSQWEQLLGAARVAVAQIDSQTQG